MRKYAWLILLLMVGCSSHHHISKKERARQEAQAHVSYYGEMSTKTYLPKTVYVHSYIKSDGTYVQSHYRSHR